MATRTAASGAARRPGSAVSPEASPAPTYAFDNAWEKARRRLTALETWLDAGTIHLLNERGVAAGWRCLEIGAGGGSIAAWLCDRVGPTGSVLATDIDPRFIETIDRPNLETLRHDIALDPLPTGAFDLIHARLVLAHLSDPASALGRIVAALKPGGWLLTEELDFVSLILDPRVDPVRAALFAKALAAHDRIMIGHGFDLFYGRYLRGEVLAHGLTDVGMEGRIAQWAGELAGATLRLTFEQLRDELIASGMLSVDELADVLALFSDPGVTIFSAATIAVWGQRPPT